MTVVLSPLAQIPPPLPFKVLLLETVLLKILKVPSSSLRIPPPPISESSPVCKLSLTVLLNPIVLRLIVNSPLLYIPPAISVELLKTTAESLSSNFPLLAIPPPFVVVVF